MDGLGIGLAAGATALAIAWFCVRKLAYNVDPIERLRSLAQLHEEGLLDEAEHQKLRRRQISRLRWSD
jgi:hypothetical protein